MSLRTRFAALALLIAITALPAAQPARHQVQSHFQQIADHEPLRFFGRPESGQTVFDEVSTSTGC